MNNHSPYNPGAAAATEVLPSPVPLAAPDEDPASFPDHPGQAQADDEPFIPKKRFTPGRSTRILACVLLVAAGFFGGTMVQKQIDLGNRAARTNVGNFQGTNGRAGAGTGDGSQTPGQGRRNGNNGANAPTSAPTGAAGQ